MSRRLIARLIAAFALIGQIAGPVFAQYDPGARSAADAARLAVPARAGLLQVRREWSGPIDNPLYSAYTWRQLKSVECPYSWARIVAFNNTDTAYTITNAKIAPTAAPGDAQTPSGGASAYAQVTWGTNAATDRPPSVSSATTSITVPARTGSGANVVYGSAVSDWVPLTALPRSDGGSWPLILSEFYVSGALQGQQNSGSNYTGYQSILTGGRTLRTTYGSGDRVTTFSTNPTEDGFQPNFALETMCQKRGLSVLAAGDSLTQGLMTSGTQNGFHLQLQNIVSTPALPISVINGGHSGQQMSAIAQNAKKYIDAYSPDVIVFPAWSPNDGSSQAIFDADWGLAMSIADYATAHGTVPILTTPEPWGSSAATDGLRAVQTARIKASGYLYADVDAAVTDGQSPAHIRPAYLAGDSNHLSDAGQGAKAAAVAVPLQRVITAQVH